MMGFEKDPSDWLKRLSPDEWIAAALGELRRAEDAYKRGDARAGVIGCKRAAGMALNGALIVEPDASLGRTYIEHVEALSKSSAVPDAVREACVKLALARPPSNDVLSLRTKAGDTRVMEAARDVIAHVYAVVKRHEAP